MKLIKKLNDITFDNIPAHSVELIGILSGPDALVFSI
jgi:hypothetical protein